MIKFLGISALGLLLGFGGAALAHDMSHMSMASDDTAATAPAATQSAAAPPDAIEINNFAFGPATVTVPVGTTITWTNKDDEPHTVVSSDQPRLFKSTALDVDDKFSFKFDKPGTYKYFCSVHPHMTGIVVVK